MTPQIGCVFRDHHQMAYSGNDVTTAAGAGIDLARLIRLNGFDHKRSQR